MPSLKERITNGTAASEEALKALFDMLDLDGDGSLTVEELESGASHLLVAGVSLSRRKVRGQIRRDSAAAFLSCADTDGDGTVSRTEFVRAIRAQEDALFATFEALGGTGASPSTARIRASFEPYFEDPAQLDVFLPEAQAALAGEPLSFLRFQNWLKGYRLKMLETELDSFRTLDTGHEAHVGPQRKGGSATHTLRIFCAGMLAGAASRTLTAPGERLKVLLATGQLQGSFSSWRATLRALVAAEVE